MNQHSETTLAYVAGLFDGEGSIIVGVSKTRLDRRNPSHWLQVSITNTNQEIIQWLLMTFGGHVSSHITIRARLGHKPCFCWRVMSNQGKQFLEQVLPHLRIKAEQARLAIEFQKERGKNRGSRPLTTDILARRDWYKREISRFAIQPR